MVEDQQYLCVCVQNVAVKSQYALLSDLRVLASMPKMPLLILMIAMFLFVPLIYGFKGARSGAACGMNLR